MSATLIRQKQETAIAGVLGADGIKSITVKPCPACKMPLEEEIFERMHDAATAEDPDHDMFSICIRCGTVLRLTFPAFAEAVTEADIEAQDPETRAFLKRFRGDVADALRGFGIPTWEEAAPC